MNHFSYLYPELLSRKDEVIAKSSQNETCFLADLKSVHRQSEKHYTIIFETGCKPHQFCRTRFGDEQSSVLTWDGRYQNERPIAWDVCLPRQLCYLRGYGGRTRLESGERNVVIDSAIQIALFVRANSTFVGSKHWTTSDAQHEKARTYNRYVPLLLRLNNTHLEWN